MIIHAVESSGNLKKKMKCLHVTTRENLGNLELARHGSTLQHLGGGTDRWLLGFAGQSVNRLCLQKNRVKPGGSGARL